MFNRVLLRNSKFLSKSREITSVVNQLSNSSVSSSKGFQFSINQRYFCQKTTPPKSEEKAKEPIKEEKQEEEEHKQEFEHDEYAEEGSANFSTGRKIMFALGKAIKYSIWTYCVLFAYHYYIVKKKEKPEEAIGWIDHFLNAAKGLDWRINDLTLLLTRPPVEKLLPDKPPLPPHVPYPKTLVIGLRGVAVHSEYKLGVGFEFKKRPGLNSFLQRMGRLYEVVIFGDEESYLVEEICKALDPNNQIIVGRIGHESTLLKDGKYIKDLSYMNRDIKDIVCLEFDPDKFYYHQNNVIRIPKWEGDEYDRALLDMIPFLEHLAQPNLDVRKELEKYGYENPGEKFSEIQSARKDLIMKQRSSGFGGMLNTLSSQPKKTSNDDEYGDTMLPSRFKNE